MKLTITSLIILSDHNILAGTVDGILKSTNDGASWSIASSGLTQKSIKSLILTRNGWILAGTAGGGIFRSMDSGTTWIATNRGLTNNNVTSFAATSDGDIFAGTEADEHGSGGGVHRSSDGGDNWVVFNSGLPSRGISSLVVNWQDVVFAAMGGAGVCRTTDNGSTWGKADSGLSGAFVRTLSVGPNNRLYCGAGYLGASQGRGAYVSTDNGESWSPADSGLTSLCVYCIEVAASGIVYAGTGGAGIFVSSDSAEHWTEADNGLSNTWVHSICLDQEENIFVGTGYYVSGPYVGSGVYRSTNNGRDWQSINSGLNSTWAHALACDTSGWLFVGTALGVFRSSDRGSHWAPTTLPATRITALCVSHEQILFGASYSGLYRSTNHGEVWEQVGVDQQIGSVNCLAGDPLRSAVYVGTGNINGPPAGTVYRSTDGGSTWILMNDGLPSSFVYCLTVDSLGNVFAGTYHYGAYRLAGDSTTWRSIGPAGISVVSLAADAIGQLFASGYYNFGYAIFKSVDHGNGWENVESGLPSAVYALASDRTGRMLAGTYRFGVFSNEPSTTAVATIAPTIPKAIALEQNYPNPFNPLTTIRYSLPNRSRVTLTVFNMLGQQVTLLENGEQEAGYHEVKFEGIGMSSGVYFYRIETGSFVQTRKLLLIR